jgi:hypothetical protein
MPELVTIGEHAVLTADQEGPPVRTDQDAADLVGEALGAGASVVVIPVSRLAGDFFQLRTGVAGAIAQKFVNYRLRLAVVGDISQFTAESGALRDFVTESNRGAQLWFLDAPEDLHRRLS